MATDKSYFVPTINRPHVNHSLFLGIVPTLIMPANVNRAGFILQNLSDTNDIWWGYDASVGPNVTGCFRIVGGDRRAFVAPPNGVWSGDLWAISDGGSRFTVYEYVQA